MNKKVKFAFLASILLIVLLLGVLLGQFPQRLDRDLSRQARIDKAIEELPEPAQTRFRERMEQMRADVEPIRAQIRAARDEAIHIMVTEPFDAAAYDRQVSRINELRVQMVQRMSDVFKEAA